MFKRKLHFFLLLPMLFTAVWPARSEFRPQESFTFSPQLEEAIAESCTKIQVTTAGVVCESSYGFTARLDFPQIDLNAVQQGVEHLPQAEAHFLANKRTIGTKAYRDIDFSLQWQPVTPEFLQIYIHEYIQYWGNRVPYRLLWSARYRECSSQNCAESQPVTEVGEILPSDIQDLAPSLAADANFNGVPVAFWNVNVMP